MCFTSLYDCCACLNCFFTLIYLHICEYAIFLIVKCDETETALQKVVNYLLFSLSKGSMSALALLDFSSAFDTMNHPILVHRLHTDFGITDSPSIVSSYLTNCAQYVSLSNNCYAFTAVLSGVSQCLVLGLIRFSMYIKPLSAIIYLHYHTPFIC